MAFRSGRFGIDINNAEFRHFRDGSGPRVFRRRIDIVPPLPANVAVAAQASIASFDIERAANARIVVFTESADSDGFDLVITTWADTQIWSVGVTWFAHTIE